MGGETFEVYRRGLLMDIAFQEAVEEARYEYGHGGYSGSIAEKDSVAAIDLVPRELDEQRERAHALIRKCDPRVDDKWGPAGALPVGHGGVIEGWLFFGWASA